MTYASQPPKLTFLHRFQIVPYPRCDSSKMVEGDRLERIGVMRALRVGERSHLCDEEECQRCEWGRAGEEEKGAAYHRPAERPEQYLCSRPLGKMQSRKKVGNEVVEHGAVLGVGGSGGELSSFCRPVPTTSQRLVDTEEGRVRTAGEGIR